MGSAIESSVPSAGEPVRKPSIDHWLYRPVEGHGPCAGGFLADEVEGLPTSIGVAARELPLSCECSPYTPSRKVEAERIWASDASAALNDAISDGLLDGCRVCRSSDRYRRSRAS